MHDAQPLFHLWKHADKIDEEETFDGVAKAGPWCGYYHYRRLALNTVDHVLESV
jgi:hypothetical protein